jgi:hypothetical protein
MFKDSTTSLDKWQHFADMTKLAPLQKNTQTGQLAFFQIHWCHLVFVNCFFLRLFRKLLCK